MQAFSIGTYLRFREVGNVLLRGRRNKVEVKSASETVVLIYYHRYCILPTYAGFLETKQSVFAGPNNKVALAASQPRLSLGIRLLGDQSIELGIVVQAEIDLCILQGSTIGINYLNGNGVSLGIVVGDVYLGVALVATYYLLRPVVIAKNLGVHQHTARSGLVEPTHIQDGKRLAGTHEVPTTVHPCFYPSVVIVGMSPAWGIYLTGRNANST